jgi:HEAT repeat protein
MRSALLFVLILFVTNPTVAVAQTGSRSFLGKSAVAWAADLKKDNPAVRRSAAYALGKCGIDAGGFVPQLTQSLGDSDESVREAAAFAIGEIGIPSGLRALSELQEMLDKDKAAPARRAAAYALGRLGERAAEAGPGLRKALADGDPRVRQNAAWALGHLGDKVMKEATPELAKLLKDNDPLVRRDTAVALSRGGPEASAAVPALTEALKDQNAAVRQYAAMALGNIGPDAEAAVPALTRMVRDQGQDREVWRESLFALPKIGGAGLVEAIPTMRKALRDPDPLTREVVAGTFIKVADQKEAQDAIPDLAMMLGDPEVRVRRNAAVALSISMKTVQKTYDEALPPMLAAIQTDNDSQVRLFLARAFWGFDLRDEKYAAARTTLTRVALHDKEPLVRYQVAFLLAAQLGPDARDVTPTLIQFLKDKTIGTVDKTTASSQTTGGEAKAGGTKVEETGGADARHLAAIALGRIGKVAGTQAKRALEEAAEDTASEKLREEAKKALKEF